MSSLVAEESNKVRTFLGEYLLKDCLGQFHVSEYNPITQELEPYGVYEDSTAFENQHDVISSHHLRSGGIVNRYFVYFVSEGDRLRKFAARIPILKSIWKTNKKGWRTT